MSYKQRTPRRVSAWKAFVQAAGALTVLLGTAVLVGWVLGIDLLIRVAPGFVPMPSRAAVSFVLAGASLLVLVPENVSHARRQLAGILALLVVGANLYAGVGQLFGLLFEIDCWLDHILRGRSEVPEVGPIPLAGILGFILVGTGLFLLSRERPREAQALASLSGLTAFFALVGYLLGAETLYGAGTLGQTALHAAAGLEILSLGLLAARPDRGYMAVVTGGSPAGMMIRNMLPAALCMPLAVGFLTNELQQRRAISPALDNAIDILATVLILGAVIGRSAWLLEREDRERLAAEGGLRRSEKRFRTFIDAAPDAVVVVDVRGILRYVSSRAGTLTGYAPEELVGQPVELVVPEGARSLHEMERHRYAAHPQVRAMGQGLDLHIRRRNGTEVPVDIGLSPLETDEGPLVIAVIRDITWRRRLEHRRETQQEVTEQLVGRRTLREAAFEILETIGRCAECGDFGFAAVWEIEPKEGVLRCAGVWRRESGGYAELERLLRSRPLAAGESLPGRVASSGRLELASDLEVEAGCSHARAALDSGLRGALALPVRVEGRVTSVLEFFSPDAIPPDEELLRMASALGNQMDLFAARERAEETLRETNEILRTLVESAPLAVISLDLDRVVRSWNPAAEAIFGWTEAETVGRPLVPTIPGDQAVQADLLWKRLVRDGLSFTGEEVRRRRKDGSEVDLSAAAAPIRDRDGRIKGAIALYADITERLQLQSQLLQSQKMESVGQLAGGVAHDFNNLLTVILGYSRVVSEELGTGHALYADLEQIRTAGERAASLTRQLLVFSRKQVLVPEIVNLNTVVTETDKMLRRVIGEDIELRMVLDPKLGNVKIDPTQVEQVIMNLCVNARDAMPTGGKLTIETLNVDFDETYAQEHVDVHSGSYVMLAVSDTGVGMDAETKSHVFEPFFTTKELGKGTGLGLATVYGIVKQSGGHIWIYSELGTGTTFKIYFPLVEEPGELSQVPGRAKPTVIGGSETILLVEDDDTIRHLVGSILRGYGYDVIEALTPQAALATAAQKPEPIHLLVTDVVMPGMNGPELASRVAKVQSGVRVLYMSGYADEAVVQHGLTDAGTAFLQKPFSPDALLEKVRAVLDERPA